MSAEHERMANPAAIFDQIEHQSTDTAPTDRYRARVEELMMEALDRQGDVDGSEDAQHIRACRAGLVLETAARRSGFVLGFEYCRTLMQSGSTTGPSVATVAKTPRTRGRASR